MTSCKRFGIESTNFFVTSFPILYQTLSKACFNSNSFFDFSFLIFLSTSSQICPIAFKSGENTENKKGTVPNLKRLRILKRILNLFGFRTKPVRYKTHFRKSRKQVPQKIFYTTDATENGFSRYGTIITSVSLKILC